MSMKQMQAVLKDCPLGSEVPLENPHIFYFLYDYSNHWDRFVTKFPGAKVFSMGFLPNWTWHINANGEPNIRKEEHRVSPQESEPITGVYGYVFLVSTAADEKIHAEYATPTQAGLVRISQKVHVRPKQIPGSTHVAVSVPAIMYFDPRNTCDGLVTDYKSQPKSYRRKWNRAMSQMMQAGMPQIYWQNIMNIVRGESKTTQPLCVRLKDLDIRRCPLSARPLPSRAQQQAIIRRMPQPHPPLGLYRSSGSLGPNIKFVRKRQRLEDGEAQPAKKPRMGPGPSNLRIVESASK